MPGSLESARKPRPRRGQRRAGPIRLGNPAQAPTRLPLCTAYASYAVIYCMPLRCAGPSLDFHEGSESQIVIWFTAGHVHQKRPDSSKVPKDASLCSPKETVQNFILCSPKETKIQSRANKNRIHSTVSAPRGGRRVEKEVLVLAYRHSWCLCLPACAAPHVPTRVCECLCATSVWLLHACSVQPC